METTLSTKEQLLVVASNLIDKGGPSAVTLRAVGDAIGLCPRPRPIGKGAPWLWPLWPPPARAPWIGSAAWRRPRGSAAPNSILRAPNRPGWDKGWFWEGG